MKQYLNILLSLFLTITSCQPAFAQTKVDGSLLKGDVIGGTASNTRRLVVPKDTKTNLDAKTRLEANLVYGTDTKKAYIDNGTDLVAVGSGSGGETNYITNGDADGASASIFVPYADAAATRPVDGTGGSPTVTTSITSTVPLMGTKSYLLTKPASNVQGQGWAIPFTVDLGYRAKASKITVQYIVNSGTFVAGSDSTESDVIWYLYDVTNSVLIEPSNIKMRASNTSISDQYDAEFQTSATGSSYRLIAHVQSTSASAYELKVDDIKITPNKPIYGSVVTGYQTVATPPTIIGSTSGSLSIGTGGGAHYTMQYARVGEEVIVRYNIRVGSSGAVDAVGAYILPPPPGITVDSSLKDYEAVGYGDISSTATANPIKRLIVKRYTASNSFILDDTDTGLLGSAGGSLFNNTNVFSATARFKVQGQGASQRLSDGYDGRTVTAKATLAASTFVATVNTTTKIPWDVYNIDDVGGFSSGSYTVKTSGKYKIYGRISTASTAGTGEIVAYLYKNGVNIEVSTNTKSGTASQPGACNYDFLADLKAGDVVDLYVFQNLAAGLTLRGNNVVFGITSINIEKLQTPQTNSATDETSLRYVSTSGANTTTSTATFLYGTKDYDSHNLYNTSTGEFKPNASGRYKITARLATVNNVSAYTLYLVIYKNGSPVSTSFSTPIANATAGNVVELNDQLNLVSTDIITIRASNSLGTIATQTGTQNILTIERVN